MAAHQLPDRMGDFARYLRAVAERLDPESGWYGVFRRRDPEGLTACLRGAEVPPWDFVESLLHDLAADDGEVAHARGLHAAAAAAHDRRPGGGEALRERLELMRREQARAAERGRDLMRRLAAVPEGTAAYRDLAHDLAWANDDHTRATSRRAELATRVAALAPPSGPPAGAPSDPAPYGRGPAPVHHHAPEAGAFGVTASAPERGRDAAGGAATGGAGNEPESWAGRLRGARPFAAGTRAGPGEAAGESGPGWGRGPAAGVERPGVRAGSAAGGGEAPQAAGDGTAGPGRAPGREARRGAKRRPRGARYAWLDDEAAESGSEPEAVPGAPELPVAAERPRGARFGGGADAEPAAAGRPAAAPTGEEDHRAALATVAALRQLRAEGRGGEAHVLLCEAASGPAARLPLLAAELHRCGLGADWPTLLWEVASLPPDRLAEAAGALAEAGRDDDCGRLLRQGVARPADEIADAVLALGDAGGRREGEVLLTAFLRVRTPEEGARIAAADPPRLVPQLLSAARAVSPARERDLVHALRVAGLIGA
ncbi:YML083C domain-containing protein [Streptomyces wuyuanensis]|uniref:UL36 very large tegument protein n=1 Tax=Streptomyces wuyuanensis TaxID=1196353 RepID=A0A1G9NC90_9ACTN|nr:hypothetical protein [Streptomyces wuyuanensis]SDL84176.1 hypothetical protein SAMN05444921_101609 [Streptomyces wuyuanensis]